MRPKFIVCEMGRRTDWKIDTMSNEKPSWFPV